MSDSRTSKPIPALDFVLVMAAAAAIITLGFTGAHSATVVVMAVTIIYVILSTLLTGADLPSAAGRGYLLCFLTSLVTLVAGMGSLSTQLNSLQVDPTDPQAAQRLLIDTACQLVPNLLMPLGLGVIIYAASSVFEAKSTVAQNTETVATPSNLIERITNWFEQQGASTAVLDYLKTVLQAAEQLDKTCLSLGTRASEAEKSLSGLNQAVVASEQSFFTVAKGASALDGQLKCLDENLIRISASVDQLHSAVGQMNHVVDEISEILSKKILEL
jgi:hypothetical protein